MPTGIYEEAYQRVMRNAAELKAAVEDMRRLFENGTMELLEAIGSIDALPDRGKMLIAWAGRHGWQNLIKEFADGVKFQAYPLQEGTRDADVISYMGQSDVTGIAWMPHNNGKPAWNSQEHLTAREENEAAQKSGGQDALTELRIDRLRKYRGGFRYPPTIENGWKVWELRELDSEHLRSLGY